MNTKMLKITSTYVNITFYKLYIKGAVLSMVDSTFFSYLESCTL